MGRILLLWVLASALTMPVAGAEKSTDPSAQTPGKDEPTPSVNEGAVPAAQKEIVTINVSIQFRMLAVSDPDPANDRSLAYSLNGTVGLPLKGLTANMSAGFSERFVTEEGDSPIRLSDSAFALGYVHRHLPENRLTVSHRLATWLPTSRTSLRRELRLAPTARSRVSYRIIGPLSASYQVQGQYRWYRYAEVPNRLAMNTQWVLGNRLGLNYTAIEHKTYGRLNLRIGLGVSWMRKYPSQDDHETDLADTALWNQSLNWNIGLEYLPIKWVGVSAGIEHGSPLRRNGIINPFFLHRDQTEFVFGLSGTY